MVSFPPLRLQGWLSDMSRGSVVMFSCLVHRWTLVPVNIASEIRRLEIYWCEGLGCRDEALEMMNGVEVMSFVCIVRAVVTGGKERKGKTRYNN